MNKHKNRNRANAHLQRRSKLRRGQGAAGHRGEQLARRADHDVARMRQRPAPR